MLDISDERDIIAELLHCVAADVTIPEAMRTEFFELRGPMPVFVENQRSFHRFYLRDRAIIRRGDTLYGGYCKDVSRKGIGFLSPVQLLPLEQIKLYLPKAVVHHLEVTRCRRLEQACYDCGAQFVVSSFDTSGATNINSDQVNRTRSE
jgi:PilZ domain